MIITRQITSHIRKMLDKFPIVSINGPRQSGKTTLLREFFQEYKYYNLERLDLRQMIMSDPIGFLNSAGDKVIFDEAQNLPELFSYIQVISDERKINGQFILSGSQSFLLNKKISQSLAGRVNINILLPFDLTEIKNYMSSEYLQLMYNGFYPRILIHQIDPQDYYPSYLQTYIERDIRTLKAIENLNTFTKFLIICAGRVGQVINLTSLANDTGISVNTVKSWLSLLEASFIIFFLKPYHNNFNKRIIKAPKLYFYDTGLICSLLRIPNKESIRNFPLYGALFENFIIGDLVKQSYHSGKQPNLFYYKESNGKEIDCIIEKSFDEIIALEIKGGETFNRDYLINFKTIFKNSFNLKVHKYLIHPKANKTTLDDIKIINWIDAPSILF